MTEKAGNPGPDHAADVAEPTAQEPAETAEPAELARDAEEHHQVAEAPAEEFLLELQPENDPDDYGPIGRPLKRHSPFYVGFFGALGAILAIWLGQQLVSIGSILVLIVVAMFLAVGLNPLVELFMKRGLARSYAVLLVIVIVLAAIALFVVAIAPVVTDQVSRISNNAPGWIDQLLHNRQVQRLDEKYDVISRLQEYVASGGIASKAFGGALGFGLALLSGLLNAFIVTVLTLYFLASLPTIKRTAYRLAPASRRARVTTLGDQILGNIGGYVLGAFIVALCAGGSTLVFLFVIGMGEYAVALAIVVALLDVIPMIGATLGAIVVIAIGFATDPKIGLICLVFFVIYQQFENYVVYPRVMSRSVDIPGSLIVIAALIGAALLGVVGALLAIPTAAALQLLLRELFLRRQDAR